MAAYTPRRIYASSLGAAKECPAFMWQLGGDKTAADRGTAIHEALEHQDASGLPTEDVPAFDYGMTILDDIEAMEPTTLKHEEAFPLPKIGRAKIDVLATFGENKDVTVLVCDWKTGVTRHNAETDLQGWAYALAAFLHVGGCSTVVVTFADLDQEYTSTATFYRGDVLALEAAVYSAYYSAACKNPKEIPGDLCARCEHKVTCKTRSEQISKALVAAKEPNNLPDITRVSDWTPDQRGEFLDKMSEAERFLKQLKANIRQFAVTDDEAAIPTGYEIGEKKGNRIVTDVLHCVTRLRELGVPDVAVQENLSISLGKMETAYMSVKRAEAEEQFGSLPRGFVGQTKDEFYELLEEAGLLSRKEGSNYLKKSKR